MMRRPDPYQDRARDLCQAAGVDPDSRIDRPGQKSMPAWCAYREAARKEHLERDAALTAEGIAARWFPVAAIPEQAAQSIWPA